jgi:UDP-2-acetamido-3-amino-2,3-dideoxy-glucuronate N-acetyltransferase
METAIAKDFKHGENLQLGQYVVIEPNVVVGNNVKLGHRCTLKSGTIVGDNSIIDDHCITTGACYIGNNVNARTGAIISKSTIIEDYCFVGPGVITNHTKHVTHGREKIISDMQLLTYLGYGSILGSQASILAGVYIAPLVIVGGGTVVVKDIREKGVYIGFPSRKSMDLPDIYQMELPENAGFMYLKKDIMDHLKLFMPNLKTPEYYSEG